VCDLLDLIFFHLQFTLSHAVVSSHSRLIRTTVLIASVALACDLAVPLRSLVMATRRLGSPTPKSLYPFTLLLLTATGSQHGWTSKRLPTEVVDACIQCLKHAMDLSMKH
jgi:hypothetical protein